MYQISVREKIAVKHYEPKTPFPTKPRRPTSPDLFLLNSAQRKAAAAKYLAALDAFDADTAAYTSAMKAYREEEWKLREQFKADLFEGLGITHAPKREALWDKVWERGHSYDLGKVLSEAEDLVDLIL